MESRFYMRPFKQIVAGIDPGLGTTGWGVIQCLEGGGALYIASGSARADPKAPLAERLLYIERHIAEMIAEYRPERLAIEKAFAGASIESAFLLGSARAACLIAAARAHIPIFEYAPTHIKKTITGTGRADKQQIGFMIRTLLPQSQPNSEHEADALAVALTESWQNNRLKEVS